MDSNRLLAHIVQRRIDCGNPLIGNIANALDCALLPLIVDIGRGHAQHFDKVLEFNQQIAGIHQLG